MNGMITIRAGDMRLLQQCTLRGVLHRARQMPLDRIDIWPRDDGAPTTVGITWRDDSFCIFDLTDPMDVETVQALKREVWR